MRFVNAARTVSSIVSVLAFLIQPAVAETSIGFQNPDDTSNILEYRLPDWGYRIWDLGFNLSGSGGDNYRGDELNSTAYNRLRTGLDTRFRMYREGEVRTFSLFAYGDAQYVRTHNSATFNESSGHDLGGRLTVGGTWVQYLGDGPFSLRAAGDTRQAYSESIKEMRTDQETEENRQFQRSNRYYASFGAGVGRIRDVTPLIRAQRLSERLTALGREQLAPGQVRDIARILATEQGYRAVFDRPDKSFWRDVLEPMLNADQPLATYEIFYLRDILEENIGPRAEGFEVRANVFYRDQRTHNSPDDFQAIFRGPALDLRWVRNLTFDHQLTLSADVNYSSVSTSGTRENTVNGGIDISHLWTIADRYRWDTSLGLGGNYFDQAYDQDRRIERILATDLQSDFTIFLENSLALKLGVYGRNTQEYRDYTSLGYDERYSRRWQWSYGIGFEYYLDRFLY